MNIFFSLCRYAKHLFRFPGKLKTIFGNRSHKDKVLFVMGATGTGKSKLSIDLANQFPAEIINSDKIQVYKGLDVVTNKVTEEECRGIPHHLIGIIDPNVDYNAIHFKGDALFAIESIIKQGKIPIIVGGSNSFVESLVNDDPYFTSRYECCFLWVDVSRPIHERLLSKRVDQMVEAGLVDEVRGVFDPEANYTQGIRRAIGVPEMDYFLRAEEQNADQHTLDTLLQDALVKTKENTCKLAASQLQKIHRLRELWKSNFHRIDATEAHTKQGNDAAEAWERLVVSPSIIIVTEFLHETNTTNMKNMSKPMAAVTIGEATVGVGSGPYPVAHL